MDSFRLIKQLTIKSYSLLLAGVIFLFSSCYYSRTYKVQTVSVNMETGVNAALSLVQLAKEHPNVVLHQDTLAWYLTKIEIDESNSVVKVTVGELADIIEIPDASTRETSNQHNSTHLNKYYDLHVYVTGLTPAAGEVISINKDNIYQFKYYVIKDKVHGKGIDLRFN